MKSRYWVLLCVAALFLYVIATGQHRSESAFDSLEKDIQKIKNAVLRKSSESTPASESEVEFMHETAAHGAHRMHAAENAQPSEQEGRGFMERASEQAALLKRNVEEQFDAITSSIMSRGQSSSSSLMEQADRRLNALKESVWSSSHEPGVQEWFSNRLTEFKDTLSAMQDAPADLKEKVDQRLTEMSDSFRQHLEAMKDKATPAASSSDSPSLKERMQEHLHSIAESLKSHMRRSPSQSQSEEQAEVQSDMPTSGGPLRQQPMDEVDPRAILVAEEATTVGEHLKQSSAALSEQLRQSAEGMRERMEESAGSLKERAESVGAHLKESVSESAESLKERAETVGAHLKESLSESAESLKERAEATGTYLKDSLAEGLHNSGERLSDLKERAADAGEYVKGKASDASHYVKDKLSDAGDSLKGHASAAKERAADASDYLRDKASDAGDYLKDKASDAGDYLKGRAHGARESADEYVQDAKERLSETAEQLKERAEFEGQRVKEKMHMQAADEEASHGLGERLGERIVGEVSSAFAATQEALRHATDAIQGTLRKIPEQLDFTHSHRYMIQSTQSVNGRSVSYSNVNGKESLVFDSDIMPSEEGQLDALNSFRKAHGLSTKNSLEAVNVVKHQKKPHHLEIVAARTTNGVGYLYEYRDGEEDLSIIGSNAPKEQPDVLKLLNSFRKQYGLPERSSLPSKLDRKELPQKGEQQATSMLGLNEASPKTEL